MIYSIFKKYVSLLLCSTAISISLSAHAVPITTGVIGAKVGKKGETIIGYRSGYESDNTNMAENGAFTERYDLFYNTSDSSRIRFLLNRTDLGNTKSEFSSASIEPVFQLFNQKEHGFDGSILTGLRIPLGDNTAYQGRVVLSGDIPLGKLSLCHNSVFAHEFGAHQTSGLRYQARFRVLYPVGDTTKVGLEMMNDFGNLRTVHGYNDSRHRLGTLLTGKFTENIGYTAGILAGISEAEADVGGKFFLSYKF